MAFTRRNFLLSICFLQLIAIIERQVFDFLGYMWAPILVNFFHIIFVIFGVFGAYQLTAKYIVTYSVWNVLWIGWNIFLICFYLNIGILDRDSDILNLGTGSVSWFEVNGYGCKPTYAINITSEDPYRLVRPERVDDCFLEYHNVELIHSAVQCFLAILGLIGAICIGRIFIDEDDDQLSRGKSIKNSKSLSKSSKQRQSLYSIEFSQSTSVDQIRGNGFTDDMILDYHDNIRGGSGGQNDQQHNNVQLSPKPMTPRRVKRRSIMTRGTTNRQSTTSRRSQSNNNNGGGGSSSNSNRNSVRNSRRKHHQNPVTKIIEQQQQQLQLQQQQQQQQQQHHHQQHFKVYQGYNDNLPPPLLTVSNLKSLNNDYVTTTSHHINNFNQASSSNINYNNNNSSNNNSNNNNNSSINPDPIYYNMNASSPLMQQSWNASSNNTTQQQTQQQHGHINPSYQHSTPNLSHSPEPIDDDLYNNRPPSVRSSYSNFHGARPLSSYNPIQQTENVFVQLSNQQQQHKQQQQLQQKPPLQQQQKPHHSQAIPQVPPQREEPRRVMMKESDRAMAFLKSGPPAYNLNYHTPPDSETTM